MKKLILLIAVIAGLYGCSNDDDSNQEYQVVPIIDFTLPETLNYGRSYQIPVTYQLTNDCQSLNSTGLTANRASSEGAGSREILIGALSLVNSNNNCNETTNGPVGNNTVSILIDQEADFTFRFLVSQEEGMEPEYESVTVPVTR